MAKKRSCRRTLDENKIHDKAVKMRKMTDVQLVHYVEDRVNKARSEGFNEGRKDYANAIHYYEKYMALVPEDERVPRDEEGNPIEGSQTFYQLADKRIKELKEEDFFQNGVNK